MACPRGLGPLLFNIYLNDIYSTNFTGSLITYADDTCLVISANTYDELSRIANTDLFKLSRWMNANCFSINDKKTNFIVFTLSTKLNVSTALNLTLHNLKSYYSCVQNACSCNRITAVSQIKYLGIIIDKNLSFKNHCSYITQKVRLGIYTLTKLRPFADVKLMKVLYYALVQSHLQYGLIVWGGTNITTLKNLVLLQKKAIRLVCNADFLAPTQSLFKKAGILNLRQLYAFKVISYAVTQRIIDFLPRKSSIRLNQFSYSFVPHSTRLLACFEVHLVKLLNNIPTNINYKDKDTLKSFLADKDVSEILAGLH